MNRPLIREREEQSERFVDYDTFPIRALSSHPDAIAFITFDFGVISRTGHFAHGVPTDAADSLLASSEREAGHVPLRRNGATTALAQRLHSPPPERCARKGRAK